MTLLECILLVIVVVQLGAFAYYAFLSRDFDLELRVLDGELDRFEKVVCTDRELSYIRCSFLPQAEEDIEGLRRFPNLNVDGDALDGFVLNIARTTPIDVDEQLDRFVRNQFPEDDGRISGEYPCVYDEHIAIFVEFDSSDSGYLRLTRALATRKPINDQGNDAQQEPSYSD